MKNKLVVIAIIVIAIIGSWGITIFSQTNKDNRIIEIKAEIKENEELGVYKKVIPLYKELISTEKDNIEWYVKLAESYYNLKQYGNFENACLDIIKTFPQDITGYFKLAFYYEKDKRHDKVIEVYNMLPESLKNNNKFSNIYEESEFKYQYLSRGYDEISQFSNDFAVVKAKGLFGYVDKLASEVISRKFMVARPFIEEMAAVSDGYQWYFIDKEGDKILATKDEFEDLHSISEGYAAAKFGGEYGFVDSEFKRIHFEYENATNFYNGVAAVQKNSKWALINNKFEKLTEYIYDEVVLDEANICSRKGIVFAKKDDGYHMLDLSGKEITKDTYEDARMFLTEEPTAVKKNGMWGFINNKGENVINFKYEDAAPFNLGIAPVRMNNKWGYIDIDGKFVINNEFDGAKSYSNFGVASVKIGKTERFIQLIKYRKK